MPRGGGWGRVVRCLRSLPGTLAQGIAARPPADLEFAPCGRWVPKAKVRVHSLKLRAGPTLSEVQFNFGECYLRTSELKKTKQNYRAKLVAKRLFVQSLLQWSKTRLYVTALGGPRNTV